MGETWAEWPLLRLLVFTPVFRLCFLVVLAALVFLALFLPKISRATPPGFLPEVRISGLDRLQAWALKRTAREAQAAGNSERALLAWRGAWANNPADLDTIRGLLETSAHLDRPDTAATHVIQVGQWLLRLGQTNRADLGLIARSWLRCGAGERAVGVLELDGQASTGPLGPLYAMSLFQAGRWEGFAALMRTNAYLEAFAESLDRLVSMPSVREPPEADFALYCAAYLAGWGQPEQRAAAFERLRAARRSFSTEILAFDLEFRVHFFLQDLDAYLTCLHEIESRGRASTRHYVGYWALLLARGDRSTARTSALGVSLAPQNLIEVYQLARTYVLLGLTDKADALLSQSSENLDWFTDTVLLYGDVLISQQAWERLRSLALRLRGQASVTAALGGYAYYLEGVSYAREGNTERAFELFDQMAEAGFADPALALRVGEGLLRLNAAQYAERVLLPHRAALAENAEFLRLLCVCAARLKNDAYLLDAAAALYALRPQDPLAANNWAAALVVFHRRPDTAILLTRQLISEHPQVPGVIDNHIGALLLNGRVEEAEALLDRIDIARLTPDAQAQYWLSRFEAHLRRGRHTQAIAAAAAIPRNELFPVQVRWLEENLRPLLPQAPPEVPQPSTEGQPAN